MDSQSKAGRSIVLFSDGTGNSSAKLQKTNVWRLYEALDLGAPAAASGAPVQIAYYDDGVGTSSFRLLAVLAGIFGFGLARNVREIYKFLCRNYRDGDRIYAFGFSRGAFTIRLLIGMVAKHGVIEYVSETDLDLQSRDVWREFRRAFRTSGYAVMVRGTRKIARAIIRAKRRLLGQRSYAASLPQREAEYQVAQQRPDITFVGVWDTVAAYGGPIVEITRAIDEWIWPLTMNDYRLHPKVKRARHALALDDKRDAFGPLPWDELNEQRLVAEEKVSEDRLKQVWFAGMHADVGGGYSDETLSYVSLCWMIDNATVNLKANGLRLLPAAEQRLRDMANKFGTIHDSRGGVGAFYRYQPRNIAALTDPPTLASYTQLDPDINYVGDGLSGLLIDPITVHSSVYDRLREGTDGYGPNNLPATFRVEGRAELVVAKPAPAIANGGGGTATNDTIEWMWDAVMLRRTVYFCTMALIALLALMPWWPKWFKGLCPGLLDIQVDARDATSPLVALANAFLPAFAERWTKTYAAGFWTFLIVLIPIFGGMAWGLKLENAMADASKQLWCAHAGKGGGRPRRNAVMRALRGSKGFAQLSALWKWSIVPNVLGILLLIAALYIVFATIAQSWLLLSIEPSLPDKAAQIPACTSSFSNPAIHRHSAGTGHQFAYDARCPLTRANLLVQRNDRYVIEIDGVDKWYDGVAPDGNTRGAIRATPSGWLDDQDSPWLARSQRWLVAKLFPVFRRVMQEPYFAPMIELRSAKEGMVTMATTQMTEVEPGKWRGHFIATRTGEVFFFINDAMLPFDPGDGHALDPSRWFDRASWFNVDRRYENNRGHGIVTIRQGSCDCADDDEPAQKAAPKR